jgi:hypothetical protein
MDIPNPHSYSGWEKVQGLAWDGRHWIVESYNYLDRFAINIKATYVGDTEITSSYNYQGPIAVYRPTTKGKATQVVADSNAFSGKSGVDYWSYPLGGNALYVITQDLDDPYGVAISMGAQ